MTVINELKAAAERNSDDWGARITLARAYKELGKVNDALLALWGDPLTPITLAQSRQVKELRAELDPDGNIDLSDVLLPVGVQVGVGVEEIGGLAIVLTGEVDQEMIRPQEKSSGAVQKISALTVALGVHLVIAVLLASYVMYTPQRFHGGHPWTTIEPDIEDEERPLKQPRISRPSRSEPSSSGLISLTSAISTTALSKFAAPDFGETSNVDVTLGLGFQNVRSLGGGFDNNRGPVSEVNFFDIRSSGSRMVFIIEASRYMLTDKKGGIAAYSKVKQEIAQMLAGLNRRTAFNLIVYDGKKNATYRDNLVAATPSNVRQAIEWFDPINKNFESIGLGEGCTSRPVQSGIEPILVNDLVHYIKASQRALEMNVDTIFLLSNGWGWHRKSMEDREYEKWMKKQNWGEKEDKEWLANVEKAREWLSRENEIRLAKGVPRRVVTSLNEIVSEILPGVRHKPGPSYSMEDVQDQLKNAVSTYYCVKGKSRPKFNVVWLVGEGEGRNSTIEAHLKYQAKRNRGRMNVLKGMAGLENVSQY